MPDRDESTPAFIPRIDPALWEEGEGFRETLLLHFTDSQGKRDVPAPRRPIHGHLPGMRSIVAASLRRRDSRRTAGCPGRPAAP